MLRPRARQRTAANRSERHISDSSWRPIWFCIRILARRDYPGHNFLETTTGTCRADDRHRWREYPTSTPDRANRMKYIVTACRVATALASLMSAYCWFESARVEIPDAPGAASGD